MPNGMRDEEFVTYGRWQQSQVNLKERIEALEARVVERQGHIWTISMTIMAGFLLPLLAGLVLGLVHLAGKS